MLCKTDIFITRPHSSLSGTMKINSIPSLVATGLLATRAHAAAIPPPLRDPQAVGPEYTVPLTIPLKPIPIGGSKPIIIHPKPTPPEDRTHDFFQHGTNPFIPTSPSQDGICKAISRRPLIPPPHLSVLYPGSEAKVSSDDADTGADATAFDDSNIGLDLINTAVFPKGLTLNPDIVINSTVTVFGEQRDALDECHRTELVTFRARHAADNIVRALLEEESLLARQRLQWNELLLGQNEQFWRVVTAVLGPPEIEGGELPVILPEGWFEEHGIEVVSRGKKVVVVGEGGEGEKVVEVELPVILPEGWFEEHGIEIRKEEPAGGESLEELPVILPEGWFGEHGIEILGKESVDSEELPELPVILPDTWFDDHDIDILHTEGWLEELEEATNARKWEDELLAKDN